MLPVVARHDVVEVGGHHGAAVGADRAHVHPHAVHLLVDRHQAGEEVARLPLVAEDHDAVVVLDGRGGRLAEIGAVRGEGALEHLLGGADGVGEARVGAALLAHQAHDVELVLEALGARLVEVVGGEIGAPVVDVEAVLVGQGLAPPAAVGAVVPGDDLAPLGDEHVVGVAVARLDHGHGVGDELELAALGGQHVLRDLGLVDALRAAGPVGDQLAVGPLAVVVEREVRVGREVLDAQTP